METFQILSDQFSHFQHLFHRWLAIFCIISSYIFDLSSSPHTWGIPSAQMPQCVLPRFIPTYVGHTVPPALTSSTYQVHPHIRGAYLTTCALALSPSGSSPHTWGIQRVRPLGAAPPRFIPTYVGHTWLSTIRTLPPSGSSPPTWGIRSMLHAASFRCTVHPHLRGAYLTKALLRAVYGGSSPPTWGIHGEQLSTMEAYRFIPTYVGHTIGKCNRSIISHGSSPPTWGIRRTLLS